MLRLGLCSGALITRTPRDVIAAAVAAGLDGVEWSGDLFASGDRTAAWAILMETLRAGLTVSSFASLYRAGSGEDKDPRQAARFAAALEAASMLHAPNLRIFAGFSPKDCSDPEKRRLFIEELRRLGEEASRVGITLCLSFGRNTYLDRYSAAHGLIAETAHSFVRLAWQPLPNQGGQDEDEGSAALEESVEGVALVLARRLGPDGAPKPFSEEADRWRRRLTAYKRSEPDPKMGRFVLIGSVKEEEGRAGLLEDAALLRGIAAELEGRKA